MISREGRKHTCNYYLVPLIEWRQTSLGAEVNLIVGLKVAVKVGHVIDGFAERVIGDQTRILSVEGYEARGEGGDPFAAIVKALTIIQPHKEL